MGACVASPQCEHRPLVRHIDAPLGASALSVLAFRFPGAAWLALHRDVLHDLPADLALAVSFGIRQVHDQRRLELPWGRLLSQPSPSVLRGVGPDEDPTPEPEPPDTSEADREAARVQATAAVEAQLVAPGWRIWPNHTDNQVVELTTFLHITENWEPRSESATVGDQPSPLPRRRRDRSGR
ncbi:hypothetical protein GQR58_029806 [Nymphon striatum]|nr:hypothetical protein GQR58_029806 [Nymphon striatum]